MEMTMQYPYTLPLANLVDKSWEDLPSWGDPVDDDLWENSSLWTDPFSLVNWADISSSYNTFDSWREELLECSAESTPALHGFHSTLLGASSLGSDLIHTPTFNSPWDDNRCISHSPSNSQPTSDQPPVLVTLPEATLFQKLPPNSGSPTQAETSTSQEDNTFLPGEYLTLVAPPKTNSSGKPSLNGFQSQAEPTRTRTASQRVSPSPGVEHSTVLSSPTIDQLSPSRHCQSKSETSCTPNPQTALHEILLPAKREAKDALHSGRSLKRKRASDQLPGHKRKKTPSARIRVIRVFDVEGVEFIWNRYGQVWEQGQQGPLSEFADEISPVGEIRSVEVRPGGDGLPVELIWDSEKEEYRGVDPVDEKVWMSVDKAVIERLVASPLDSENVPWPTMKR